VQGHATGWVLKIPPRLTHPMRALKNDTQILARVLFAVRNARKQKISALPLCDWIRSKRELRRHRFPNVADWSKSQINERLGMLEWLKYR
jgi:hypothetical protein